jgi:ribulose-5-phosphate 4-epimerase/fuculose-1-phosphate aldolase
MTTQAFADSAAQDTAPEEWEVRVDLAAAFRLVALYGWSDFLATHLSARVPGPEDQFLINPFGMLFEEITASCLVKVDLDGNLLGASDHGINPAGFTIHSAVHGGRPEIACVIHTHTPAGVGTSARASSAIWATTTC